jgi:hypothetical protein
MDIADKQRRALASLLAFQTNPPSFWDENAVSQFNEVVSALGKAFERDEIDLSSFLISEAELKPYEDESGSTSWVEAGRFPARKQMPEKRYCDENFAQRKLDSLVIYFQNPQPKPERQNKNIGF